MKAENCVLLLLLIACFLSGSTTLKAEHIIGGSLRYECLGGGTYRFECKIFRDCAGGGSYFDSKAIFTIYRGSETTPVDNLEVPYDQNAISFIDPPDDPCVSIPEGICVQQAIYAFEYTFTDWPSSETYHVAYQRCCRNISINNIIDPNDTGATYVVEISPAAQAGSCNNSPEFDHYPPTVVCRGQPIEIDHSATDPDGDQLVYSLCAPLAGGGTLGEGCYELAPDPACPPPYLPVVYHDSLYSAQNPLGGTQSLSIDPQTGLMTGLPEYAGQFVVGVCVTELRNGEVIGRTRREIQFNVAECITYLQIVLETENLSPEGLPVFESCGDTSLFFPNNSIISDAFEYHSWKFQLGPQTVRPDEWEPTVQFPGPGEYPGQLILQSSGSCADSSDFLVRIYEPPVAKYRSGFDVCYPGPLSLSEDSESAPGITEAAWLFDGQPYQGASILIDDPAPGIYPLRLSVTDANGCVDTLLDSLTYLPAPSFLFAPPVVEKSCPPLEVHFDHQNQDLSARYETYWEFGDGSYSNDPAPTHRYTTPGTYDVYLSVLSPDGCVTDTLFQNLIEILPPPHARFSYEPAALTGLNRLASFRAENASALRWDWTLDDRPISDAESFDYEFPDTGRYEMTLAVTLPHFCSDTLSRVIDVEPLPVWHLPNAFSPNGDGTNDQFLGAGDLLGARNFELKISNRYGQVIFETDDPYASWDGRIGGKILADNYVWQLKIVSSRGKSIQQRGMVTVIK